MTESSEQPATSKEYKHCSSEQFADKWRGSQREDKDEDRGRRGENNDLGAEPMYTKVQRAASRKI